MLAHRGLRGFLVLLSLTAVLVVVALLSSNGDEKEVKGLNIDVGQQDLLESSNISEEIESLFRQSFEELDSNASLVLINLETKEEVRINDQKVHTSASLYKLFTAFKTYQAIQSGVIDDTDKVRQCLNKSITASDNKCSLSLAEELGWDNIDKQLARQGYDGTILNNYDEKGDDLYGNKITTADDVALLLGRLHDGSLLSDQYRNDFLDLLSRQEINDRVAIDKVKGISFAHKTGNVDGYIHDAGYIIKESEYEYLYVIMTSGWQLDEEGVDNILKFSNNLLELLYL